MSSLYLIDGSSYIYRAYHAIRGLSTRDGFPTNAVFGFANMLLKILRDHQPTYVAIVLDSKGPTFRHERYPQYKANRPPMPEDLRVQLPRIEELIDAFNIPALQKEGFEADDIIATLVKRWSGKVDSTVVVSSDKDLMQLVSGRVRMLDTMKEKWIGVEEVRERFGVDPERVPDALALAGDTSDNVPGLPGVGPKTAGKLISAYGTLEGLIERKDEIDGKVGRNLASGVDAVRLALSLVTLDRDVDLRITMDDLTACGPDVESLRTIFQELGFTSLIRGLTPQTSLGREGYHIIGSEEELIDLAGRLRGVDILAVDTETTDRDAMKARLVGISLSWEPGRAAYVPLTHSYLGVPRQIPEPRAREILGPVLGDPSIHKVGQNVKYDMKVLARSGWALEGVRWDTMIASYLVNPSRRSHSLSEISAERLNHTMISYDEVTKKGKKRILFSDVPVEEAGIYSCEDADVTFRALKPLLEDLERMELLDLFQNVEMPLVRVLKEMEMVGVLLDIRPLLDLSSELLDRLKELEAKIHMEVGRPFNVGSPKQLSHVLFEVLKLPALKKTKTGYSTSSDVLIELSSKHHLPAMVLEYRSMAKLKSTYLDALPALINPETGRIHTSFNQTATATGRLSSSNPNLQNIPIRTELGRRIRGAFVAPEGSVLLSADYSQIELRILAHLSGDTELLEAFRKGEDVHARTARQVLGAGEDVEPELRRRAKVINFGIIYGMSAFGLSKELGVHPKEAAEIIDGYFDVYSGVKAYIDRTLEEARTNGYVMTLMNRRRYLPELTSANPNQRQLGERMAVNTPIQGTAADLIKVAMIAIHGELGERVPEARMILQVHDELVFEVPEDHLARTCEIVRDGMEKVAALQVPLVVDLGTGANWAEAH
ncbi:MAG: DNA polymerase I [Deltaproteobacteria bacterium]|nr:DNA polymerase I [Deltaproteobacteria bacterium]